MPNNCGGDTDVGFSHKDQKRYMEQLKEKCSGASGGSGRNKEKKWTGLLRKNGSVIKKKRKKKIQITCSVCREKGELLFVHTLLATVTAKFWFAYVLDDFLMM